MARTARTCLDSSVLLKLVVPEADTYEAERLWVATLAAGRLPVAPDFPWAEVGSALLRRERQGRLSAGLAAEAWGIFRDLPVVFIPERQLADRAWFLARRWKLATVYDAAFLAAGEEEGEEEEFWTADTRLVQALGSPQPGWVHVLGQAGWSGGS